MSDWPKRYEALDLDEDIDHNTPDRWVQCVSFEDFDRLLEFAISAIQAAGQTDRDREAIRHDILETIRDRIWREKNGNMAD